MFHCVIVYLPTASSPRNTSLYLLRGIICDGSVELGEAGLV